VGPSVNASFTRSARRSAGCRARRRRTRSGAGPRPRLAVAEVGQRGVELRSDDHLDPGVAARAPRNQARTAATASGSGRSSGPIGQAELARCVNPSAARRCQPSTQVDSACPAPSGCREQGVTSRRIGHRFLLGGNRWDDNAVPDGGGQTRSVTAVLKGANAAPSARGATRAGGSVRAGAPQFPKRLHGCLRALTLHLRSHGSRRLLNPPPFRGLCAVELS